MKSWLLAARPKTLVAGLIPVMVGTAAAHREGGASFGVFICALLGALLIQIATNFVNDAADFLRGADNEHRIGPKRAAQLGLISPHALYLGATLCFILAATFGAYLISVAGWPIMVIGAASILAAIAYTAGPFPLAYWGLGDLFVLIFFGFVAVCGTVIAHGREISLDVYVWGLAIGLHATALIAVNNIRDIATDIVAGKKTMAVRMGESASRFYIGGLLLLPFGLVVWRALDEGPQLFFAFFALPVAVLAVKKIFSAQTPKDYMAALPVVALVQLVFGCALSAAIFFSGHLQ